MAVEESTILRVAFQLIAPLYLLVILGLPTLACTLLFGMAAASSYRLLAVAAMPAVFGVAYAGVAALLSYPHQRALVPGRFSRRLGHALYFHRRLYGLCWTSVYYFTPVLHGVLSVPWLRTIVFRAFGYRGSSRFTTYPDTWIRDLPLLELEADVYLSNRATLGTNVVMSDGTILVDRIRIGRNAVVGHLAVIGPGSEIGEWAEVGVATTLGMNVRLGKRVRLGACCRIGHGVRVADGTSVGAGSQILHGASIGPGLELPAGASVPPRVALALQEDVDRLAMAR